jgi:hypothetical protein
MHPRAGVVVEEIGDRLARGSTGRVAIEQEDEVWGSAQELSLGGGEMNPEQRHGRNADLGQAHDAPGALHHRQPLRQARSDAVKAIEDLAFRQARGKFPLPIVPRLCGIEPAAGLAEGPALGIMEADGEASLEESGTGVGPGLKVAGCLGPDALVREQGRVRIEPQRSGIGWIGPLRGPHLGPWGHWHWRDLGQGAIPVNEFLTHRKNSKNNKINHQ